MNQYQRQVEQKLLENEKEIRNRLKRIYSEALGEVKGNLKKLQQDPNNQTKAMQIQYQKMLEAQLEGILNRMGDSTDQSMTDYLNKMYEDGYLGCLYGMHKDGVGLVLAINEDQVEKVVRKESAELQFSERLYRDTEKLKEQYRDEMSRGLSTGKSYAEIARQLSLAGEASLKQAFRIAQTEGHRVQSESKFDCMHDAREKGAEIVKQWDSTVDSRTRATHRELADRSGNWTNHLRWMGKEQCIQGDSGFQVKIFIVGVPFCRERGGH